MLHNSLRISLAVEMRRQRKILSSDSMSPDEAATGGDTAVIKDASVTSNIFSVHDEVIANFKHRASSLPDLEQRLLDLGEEIDRSLSVPNIKRLEIEHKTVSLKMHAIVSGEEEKQYRQTATMLLGKHSRLSRAGDVAGADRASTEYLAIASKYVTIRVKKERKRPSITCVYCGADISLVAANSVGVRICTSQGCGFDNAPPKSSLSSKEYDVWGNFLKAYKRFTGAIKVRNIGIVMQDLDKYFVLQGRPAGAYYRSLPVNDVGQKDGTSRDDIFKAFSDLKYRTYYKNYMYVCHEYYGWLLPSLDHLLPVIKNNFDLKQEVWRAMVERENRGQSSLPTEFRLCMELNHAGYECDVSQFKVSDKMETLERYYSTYQAMCTGAGFKFPHE